MWEVAAKCVVRRYGNENAAFDASDVVGDEIAKMLSAGGDRFKTYDETKSVRAWRKACIRHRAIDLLRRRRTSELPQEGPATELTNIVEALETYELFRMALGIADDICELRGNQKEMAIFRTVRQTTRISGGRWYVDDKGVDLSGVAGLRDIRVRDQQRNASSS